jgi:hypothetical protein
LRKKSYKSWLASEARPEGCRNYPIESVGGRFRPRWEIAVSKFKEEQEEAI